MVVDRPVSAARAGRAPRAALLAGRPQMPGRRIDREVDIVRCRCRYRRSAGHRERATPTPSRSGSSTAIRRRRQPAELAALLASGEARSSFKALALTHAEGKRWLLVGLGARERFSAERARVAAATVLDRARELSSGTLCWQVPGDAKRAARSCARRGHDHQRLPLRAPQVRRRRAGRRRYAARARATADRRCARRRRRRRGGRTARRRRQPRARPAESPGQ